MWKLKANIKAYLLKRYPGLRNYREIARWIYEKAMRPLRHMPGSSLVWGPPRGMYKDAASYNSKNPLYPFKEVILKPIQTDTYKLPWSNSAVVTAHFKKHVNTEVVEKKAWFLKNARYLGGHSGTIITVDDKIFLPLSPPQLFRTVKNHQAFFFSKLPKMAVFKKVILIDTLKGDENNYCHWLRDHLCRFFWLKQLDIDFSEYTLIASMGTVDFCRVTMEEMIDKGFKFKEWLFTRDFKHFYADEIIVPPYVNFEFRSGIFDMGEIGFLKELWLTPAKSGIQTYDKIYLSRRKAARRYTSIQPVLTERLAYYGVKEVVLEDLTIFEQAAMLNNASLIVGLHGAAFVNLVFCKPDTTVIEIFSADYVITRFWSIAEKLKLNYYAYCDDEFIGLNTHKWRHQAPTFINVDNFINCFTQLNLL